MIYEPGDEGAGSKGEITTPNDATCFKSAEPTPVAHGKPLRCGGSPVEGSGMEIPCSRRWLPNVVAPQCPTNVRAFLFFLIVLIL